ncbi:MAG: outer membrane beta-barrel protein [Nitrospirae bacterium]|nr:outer membrane beta-barrel protein [Nitrospirota bacterium]
MAIRHNGFILTVTLLIALSAIESAVAGVEITPSIHYRFGGGFEDADTATNINLDESAGYGLVLDFDIQPDRQVEVYLSRQNTTMSSGGPFTGNPLFDVSVDYYHIGGLYLFKGERFRPFISGTLGLTRMDPQRADLRSETRMSLALGGGAKFFFTESLGIRLDVRGIYTAINSDASIFCAGGCAVQVRSSGFFQGELGAGLILRFP